MHPEWQAHWCRRDDQISRAEGTVYTDLAEFHLKLDSAQRHTEAQESGPAWEESSEESDGSLVPERLSQEWGDLMHWWAPHARAEARGPWVL